MKFLVRAFDASAFGNANAAAMLRDLHIEAPNVTVATQKAQSQGLTVVSARAVGSAWRATNRNHLSKSSVHLFCQELLALLRAGMGLVEAIEILQQKAKEGALREVLGQVVDHLHAGKMLSNALELVKLSPADGAEAGIAVFPTLLVATIRSAERTGQITEALKRYLDYQTELNAVRDKVVAASIYPALLLGVGVLVILFLMTYVVPKFSSIYADVGQDHLPMLSRWLMQWGILINEHLLAIAIGFVATLGLCARTLAHKAVQSWLIQRFWKLPRVGEYLRTYQLAQFVRTLSMLLSGGVPLVRALDMTSDLLAQPALSRGLIAARQAISEGQSVSDAFAAHGLATAVGVRLLVSGERSGDLAQAMSRIAGFYDAEVERAVAWFSRLFEPVLMIVIGLSIGAIIILMYMPIFELAGSIQ